MGYLFLLSAVGIGAGSWLAGQLSGRHVEIGIVPLGAIGMATGAILLGLANHVILACIGVTLIGISAGLYLVPLNALIQWRCPREKLGQVLAISGFIGWIGVLLAALVLMGLTALNLSPAGVFLLLGIETLFLAGIALWQAPDFFVRFLIIIVVKTLYRIRTLGDEKRPDRGPGPVDPQPCLLGRCPADRCHSTTACPLCHESRDLRGQQGPVALQTHGRHPHLGIRPAQTDRDLHQGGPPGSGRGLYGLYFRRGCHHPHRHAATL